MKNEGILLMKNGTIDGGKNSALINNKTHHRTNVNLVKAEIWDGTLKSSKEAGIQHYGNGGLSTVTFESAPYNENRKILILQVIYLAFYIKMKKMPVILMLIKYEHQDRI